MKKTILFIVNPISGVGKQKLIQTELEKHLDLNKFTFSIVFTEYGGHATLLAANGAKSYDIIIAVGGDGTVNEVAKGLMYSECIMGIIPVGSGNGLARHLKLSMRIPESIKVINKMNKQTIDMGNINGNYFINVAGVGFDAHVAHLYSKTKKRGPLPYAKIMTNEFNRYRPVDYEVVVDGDLLFVSAFLISFANSSQFGNNAFISPNAIINDGLIDVCVLKSFPMVEAGQLALKLFDKRLDKSKYMKIIRGKEIKIKTKENMLGHIDGEPVDLPNKINVCVKPASIKIIYNADNQTFPFPVIKDLLNPNNRQ